jgi:AhpD family alkylhydroperoxidase
MRLQPIDKPKGLMMRLAFAGSRRQFGKVLMPMKVLYTRVPAMLKVGYAIQKFDAKIQLEKGLHFLLAGLTAEINGCGFCVDIGQAAALREHVDMNKFSALAEYRTSQLFSERERAALTYVEEATRNKRVSDATFDALRKNFSEAEIVEITYINALENFYNLINIPLQIESDGLCAIAQKKEEMRHDTPQRKGAVAAR